MFPLNLQRNIVQLDRQISLLENECKNMEIERRKRNFETDPSCHLSSKISSTMFKPSSVKVTSKKNDNSKKSKKTTPSLSTRFQCINSLPTSTKMLNELGDSSVGKKTKMSGPCSNTVACPCQVSDYPNCKSRKEQKSVKCDCNEEDFDVAQDEHLWRKELLIPHCGGAIEVTLTQKPNREKNSSLSNVKLSNKKLINLENKVEKDTGGCKCYMKGPKWSDILCLDSSKKKMNNGSSAKSKITADETKVKYKPLNFNNNKRSVENVLCEHHNNYSGIKEVNHEEEEEEQEDEEEEEEKTFQAPVKLPCQSFKSKEKTDVNSNKFEKETQCTLDKCCNEPVNELKDSKDPVKLFQYFIGEFKKMPIEELKKLSAEGEPHHNLKEFNHLLEESKINTAGSGDVQNDQQNNADSINTMKNLYEALVKEKNSLQEELKTRDNTVAMLKKREEEYLLLINSLKSNLEAVKGNSQGNVEALKEINLIKNKLAKQVKVSETLKKNYVLLQNVLEQCSIENDRLKTQIKIFKLEAQKHEFVLAGKQAEIDRYKEEIQNFHRQISEHLATLKSNSEGIDIEKMIETIVQQSLVFAQTEMDSVLEKDQKDSSKSQNIFVHSSPNTTATSVVNSSWKQISSIHDQDQDQDQDQNQNQSKANSDVAIYLNDDSNEKDFFQLFEKNSLSEFASPRKVKKSSAEKSDKKEIKYSSSFTSCISADANSVSSEREKNSDRDSLISNEPLISFDEKSEEIKKNNSSSRISVQKAQSNIDELLKNMKLKFSKEVFETSIPSCATEDFLCVSQISGISPC